MPPGENNEAFEKFKTEGFKNPDGSSFDPDTGFYTRATMDKTAPRTFKVASPEEAFKFRQPNARPFKEDAIAAAEGTKETGTAEAKTETGEALAKLKTVKDLGGLKEAMGNDFQEVVKEIKSLPAQVFQGDFPLTKDFNADDFLNDFGSKAENQLRGVLTPSASNPRVTELVKKINGYVKKDDTHTFTEMEVANLLAGMYAVSAKESLAKEIKDKRLVEFISYLSNEAKTYQMHYDVNVDNAVLDAKVEAKDKEGFAKDFKSFEINNPVIGTKEAVEKAAKEGVDGERLGRAKKFRSTFAGKFLSMAGIVSLEEPPVDSDGRLVAESDDAKTAREKRNNNVYADVLKGDNFIAKWFIFIFGGGAMIDGGTADIEKSIAGLDSKFKPLVDKFQLMAKKSPLNLEKTAAELASPIKAPEGAKALTSQEFKDAIGHDDKIPVNGFSLKEDYKIPEGQKLVVTLGDGAEMTLVAGKSMWVNGVNEVANSKDDKGVDQSKSFKGVVNITNTIPIGTAFSGRVKLVQVAQDKKPDVAKPVADVAPDNQDEMAS